MFEKHHGNDIPELDKPANAEHGLPQSTLKYGKFKKTRN